VQWKHIDDLEIAVAEYIDWFDHRRLHAETGHLPSGQHENHHYPAATLVSEPPTVASMRL
jgi:putative transposase